MILWLEVAERPDRFHKRRDETQGRGLLMYNTLETGRWCFQATDKTPSADTESAAMTNRLFSTSFA